MQAARLGDLQKVYWWLAHKADVNSVYPPDTGRTPLHEAVDGSHIDLVGLLLMVSHSNSFVRIHSNHHYRSY
jgi:hypothetical protein